MKEITYTLQVDEQPADKRLLRRLRRVEAEEHADMADMLRLEFATSVREEKSGWSLVDEGIFERFTHLQFGLQTGTGSPDLLLDVYVIDVNVQFSSEPGQSTFEVVAMDYTTLMNREEKRKRWEMRHSTIANEIFKSQEYDLAAGGNSTDSGSGTSNRKTVQKTEPGEKELEAPVVQRGTDAQLLGQLADQNGYLFYVETNTDTEKKEGHFHPLEREKTSLNLEIQQPLRVSMGSETNVASFDVRYEMTKPFEAVGAGVKAESKEDQEVAAQSSSGPSRGNTSTLEGKKGKKFVRAAAGQRGGDLQSYSQVLADRSSYAIRATGQLRTVDYEHVLRAKRPVQVEGAGDTFSVQYYVEQVQHVITEEEYIQEFTLRTNALEAKANQPLKPKQ